MTWQVIRVRSKDAQKQLARTSLNTETIQIINNSGRGKTQVRLPGTSTFCFWASENGRLVVRWASEISLSIVLLVDIK